MLAMNKLKSAVESVGLSFKREIIQLIVLNLLIIGGGVALYIYSKNIVVIAFTLLSLLLLNYLYLTRYKSIKIQNEDNLRNEFISLLSFFKTYIKNDFSVYQCFKEITNFTSGILLERINKLIEEIDNDKSITPFINFSNYFHNMQIEQLMICLYQMVDEGSNIAYLSQFELLFSKLRDESLKDELDHKYKSLSTTMIFPLIGSALLIVMITFGIVQVIGDSLNGL